MRIWLFEWDPEEVQTLQSETLEELREEGRVLAEDVDWVLLQTDYDHMQRLEREVPGGHMGLPAPGKWVDSEGNVIYLDYHGNVVKTAAEVVETIEEIADEIAFVEDEEEREYLADSLLEATERVF